MPSGNKHRMRDNRKVDMLRFADDIAIVTDNENDLQNILHTMINLMTTQFNIKINKKETKILICSRMRMEEDRQRTVSIILEDFIIINMAYLIGTLLEAAWRKWLYLSHSSHENQK
uniref:Reverse transcriptase domain-containing protein n=1 Tax=Cacopsylla melanoneura TaxID=428564 RepID=A0A8D9E0C2_9HEMI